VWIRRFENEEERKSHYDAVCEREYWKKKIKPEADEVLDRDRMRMTRLEPTPKSILP
jgi:hypothetical protein